MPDTMTTSRRTLRGGFTLIEAMVAVTITLIMMLALSKGFVMLSDSIGQGRARLNLSDQLRGITSVLREDLDGMTAGGNALSEACQSGYIDYYEGPLSDYTATLVNYNSTQENIEQKIPSSRYGDFDDILAFTAKAKKGRWFYGEVPYPIVMGPIQLAAGGTPTFTADQWAQTVTVASDTAEIIYFMIPTGADPTSFLDTAGNTTFASVYDPVTNQYASDPTVNGGVPERMMLCRRVLLILPSLNISSTSTTAIEPALFHDIAPDDVTPMSPAQNARLFAEALANGVDSFRTGLRSAYQRCDLSVRRVSDGNLETNDPIAANSLSDLQNPRNRFAHTVLPIAGTQNTTMPLWSLTSPMPLQQTALSGGRTDWFGLSLAGGNSLPECGFLYPQFLRQRRVDPIISGQATPENRITYELAFSEVVATNCVAFDVRGYDDTVPVLYHPGRDGFTGNTNDNSAVNFGESGSDDVALTPSDPGYANAFELAYTATANIPFHVAKRGAFVDAGWPLTTRAMATYVNANSPQLGPTTTWPAIAGSNAHLFLNSSLSMTNPIGGYSNGLPAFTLQAQKSGRIGVIGERLRVYQPGFDSFTTKFEHDGYLQANGVWVNGQLQYAFPAGQIPVLNTILPDPNADLGANGVDDNLFGGVDDLAEHDAAPPVTSPMKAIQVLIRLEDKGASVIQQMVVSHELRLEN